VDPAEQHLLHDFTDGWRRSSERWATKHSDVVTCSEADAQAAVGRWRDFPVTAHPRPTVLVGPPDRPQDGFVDGPSKMAYDAGVIDGAAGVPEEPLRILRGLGHPAPAPVTAPLIVTSAEHQEATFWTDRGRCLFPAWRLEAVGARGPIWVMDEAALASCWFPPALEPGAPRSPHDAISATLGADGVTLDYRFVGSAPSVVVCYELCLLETRTAVCIIAKAIANPELPPRAAVPAVGVTREVRVRLSRPLGERVLVAVDGSPVEVTHGSGERVP